MEFADSRIMHLLQRIRRAEREMLQARCGPEIQGKGRLEATPLSPCANKKDKSPTRLNTPYNISNIYPKKCRSLISLSKPQNGKGFVQYYGLLPKPIYTINFTVQHLYTALRRLFPWKRTITFFSIRHRQSGEKRNGSPRGWTF